MLPSNAFLPIVRKIQCPSTAPGTPSHQARLSIDVQSGFFTTTLTKNRTILTNDQSVELRNINNLNESLKKTPATRQAKYKDFLYLKLKQKTLRCLNYLSKSTSKREDGLYFVKCLNQIQLFCEILDLNTVKVLNFLVLGDSASIFYFNLWDLLHENFNNYLTPKQIHDNVKSFKMTSKYISTEIYNILINTLNGSVQNITRLQQLIAIKSNIPLSYISKTTKFNNIKSPIYLLGKNVNNLSYTADPQEYILSQFYRSITQNTSIMQNIFSFMDAREIIRINFALNLKPFIQVNSSDTYNLWKSKKESVRYMCPSMFLNRKKSFFDPVIPPTDNNDLVIEHVVLDSWWNKLRGKDDNYFFSILAQSPLKTIRVEPGFYKCLCHSCINSVSVQSCINSNQSNLSSYSAQEPNAYSNIDESDSNHDLSSSNNSCPCAHSEQDNSLEETLIEFNLPLSESSEASQDTDNPMASNVLPNSPTNERRPTHQLAEMRVDNIDRQYMETDLSTLMATYDVSNESSYSTSERYTEYIPCPTDITSDNLSLIVAKRHAVARFFWLLRLLLVSRNTIEYIDFNGPPEILQSMCDQISSIPELPINFKNITEPYEFKKLRYMSFGLATDCRYVVPLLDFCKYNELRTVHVIGLTANYETLKPQFGVQPTVMFSPNQVFSPSSNYLASIWLPAVYNGPIDENFQLQGQGIYVSREYHYEGSFKNGRNHGWGKMISKCGEIYEGYWNKGRRCGPGVVTQLYGKRLEGNWLCDCMHGRGTMITRRGRKYEGDWNNGSLNGWAVISENGILQAVCQFHDGIPCGWMRCRNVYFHSTHLKSLKNPIITPVPKNFQNEHSSIKPLKTRIVIGSAAIKFTDDKFSDPSQSKIQDDLKTYMIGNSNEVISEDTFLEMNNYHIKSGICFENSKIGSNQSKLSIEQETIADKFPKFKTSILEQLNSSEWMDIWTFTYKSTDMQYKALNLLNPPQSLNDLFVLNSNRLIQHPGLKSNYERTHQLIIPSIPSWVESLLSELNI